MNCSEALASSYLPQPTCSHLMPQAPKPCSLHSGSILAFFFQTLCLMDSQIHFGASQTSDSLYALDYCGTSFVLCKILFTSIQPPGAPRLCKGWGIGSKLTGRSVLQMDPASCQVLSDRKSASRGKRRRKKKYRTISYSFCFSEES